MGAQIMVKGSKTGTVTDIDGKFSLPSVKQGADQDSQQGLHIGCHTLAASFFLFFFSIRATSHWEKAMTTPRVRKPPTGITIFMAG